MRRIHLLGGPDAASIQLMDADSGELLKGVTKVELLLVPGGGALVNVTQSCRLMGINMVATDAGQPLIDLPEDAEPEPVRVIKHGAITEDDKQFLRESITGTAPFAGAAKLGQLSPAEQQLADTCAHFGVAPPAEHVADAQRRIVGAQRATSARTAKDRTVPGEPIGAPPPLPEVPKQARRAPPPEPEAAPEQPEPDLSQDDKDELSMLLARAAGTSATELQLQQVNSAPWPFAKKG